MVLLDIHKKGKLGGQRNNHVVGNGFLGRMKKRISARRINAHQPLVDEEEGAVDYQSSANESLFSEDATTDKSFISGSSTSNSSRSKGGGDAGDKVTSSATTGAMSTADVPQFRASECNFFPPPSAQHEDETFLRATWEGIPCQKDLNPENRGGKVNHEEEQSQDDSRLKEEYIFSGSSQDTEAPSIIVKSSSSPKRRSSRRKSGKTKKYPETLGSYAADGAVTIVVRHDEALSRITAVTPTQAGCDPLGCSQRSNSQPDGPRYAREATATQSEDEAASRGTGEPRDSAASASISVGDSLLLGENSILRSEGDEVHAERDTRPKEAGNGARPEGQNEEETPPHFALSPPPPSETTVPTAMGGDLSLQSEEADASALTNPTFATFDGSSVFSNVDSTPTRASQQEDAKATSSPERGEKAPSVQPITPPSEARTPSSGKFEFGSVDADEVSSLADDDVGRKRDVSDSAFNRTRVVAKPFPHGYDEEEEPELEEEDYLLEDSSTWSPLQVLEAQMHEFATAPTQGFCGAVPVTNYFSSSPKKTSKARRLIVDDLSMESREPLHSSEQPSLFRTIFPGPEPTIPSIIEEEPEEEGEEPEPILESSISCHKPSSPKRSGSMIGYMLGDYEIPSIGYGSSSPCRQPGGKGQVDTEEEDEADRIIHSKGQGVFSAPMSEYYISR